ncbi:MAG TPA: hypothetical protein VEJ89_09800 [Myxococcaceae bacterium]|nr:hypothetical protein [Myxococcaceae bacterium]
MRWPALLPAVLLVLGACASVGSHESGLCPESSSLKCMSAPECSMDKALGCKVCQCSQPLYNPVAPDKRLTPN